MRWKNQWVILPIIILLIIQIPNLGLPYFYDEAWSYIPSIVKMKEAGPSLLPGVIPIEYCKGHPQFFFFISSLWMKLFSENIIIMRTLPLLFSVGTLLAVYFGLLRLVNRESAITASLLLSVQSMFLAQAIFFLPEMLMTLFFVLSFFFILEQRFLAYSITGTLMVLTKETAIIFAILFGIYYLFSLFIKSNREKFKYSHLLALLMPGLIYLLFLILHYRAFGVVFYGDHLQYILTDRPFIFDKIHLAYSNIFIWYGRRYIWIFLIIGIMLWLIQKPRNAHLLILAILSFLAYMTFSIFNFYSQRYGLVAMVLLIILTGFIAGQLKLTPYVKIPVILGLASVCLYYSLTEKQNADIDLGYVETIKVHQDLVHYCQENNLYDEPLSVSFNMIFALKEKELGYVKGPKGFTKVMDWKHYMQGRYYIYESTMENNPTLDSVKQHFKLIKTFTRKHAYGSIYENTNFQDSTASVNSFLLIYK
jgi:4-amino-4-deoxy-L-arabinose transferase-like glycosyltransferase